MKKPLLQVLQARTARSWLNSFWRKGMTFTARSAAHRPITASVLLIWKENLISTCITLTSATR